MNPLNIVLLVILITVVGSLSLYHGYWKFKSEQASQKKKWNSAKAKRN